MSSRTEISLFDPQILRRALVDALVKLNPATLLRNPVMFVVEVVAGVTTLFWALSLWGGAAGDPGFIGQIAAWLWFTTLFANFAEAIAEGRGKAQAEALRRTKTQTMAKRLPHPQSAEHESVPATALGKGDIVIAEAGDII